MGKVLIIGAGGVGTVVAHKVAQNPDVFTEIMIASRTKSKCDAVVKAIGNPNIKTAQVDADNVDELVALFNSFKPEIVINVALPYQDLTIMEACLKSGVNYLDTANYEPKDVAHFEYSWQWAYKKRRLTAYQWPLPAWQHIRWNPHHRKERTAPCHCRSSRAGRSRYAPQRSPSSRYRHSRKLCKQSYAES